MARDFDDEDERPARRADPRVLYILLGAVAGGLMLVAASILAGYLLFREAPAPVAGPAAEPGSTQLKVFKPRADVEGVQWNQQDLNNYLAAQLHVTVHTRADGRVYLSLGEGQPEVFSQKCISPQQAHDLIDTQSVPAVNWGRFLFSCEDRKALDRVLSVLG